MAPPLETAGKGPGPSSLNPMFQAAMTAVCLISAVLPFVAPSFPVGTDFPKHALVANILAHYHDPMYGYDQHFNMVLSPRATMLGELVLAALTCFVSAFVAVKLYLVFFVLTLWLSGQFLLKKVNESPVASLLLLPIAHSFLVFSGFLPFLGSIAIFPFLIGVLIADGSTPLRSLLVSVLLLTLYGFHLMGAFVGLVVVGVFALCSGNGQLRPLRCIVLDLLATVPVVAFCGYFMLQKDTNITKTVFQTPLGQIKAYFGYNIWPLSLHAGWILGAGLLFFAIAGVRQVYRRNYDIRLCWSAVLLVLIGLFLPVASGAGFVIGSRTLPFAIITAIAMFRFTKRGLYMAVTITCAVLTSSATLNTTAALRVQPYYRTFLSGLDTVHYGSRLISVVEDLSLGGNRYIQPFAGMEDAYNIYRGGSNGYALAVPYVPTGGAALRLKYAPEYTYKYTTGVSPNYHGVGSVYDYVLVYGNLPQVTAVLQTELDLVYRNDPLSIYKSRVRVPGNNLPIKARPAFN